MPVWCIGKTELHRVSSCKMQGAYGLRCFAAPLCPRPAGQAKGGSRKEADAPQFAGTGGQGRASARAFCTLARRGLHTAVPAWAKGGLGWCAARLPRGRSC